ncbi:MAG: hypothetical protein ICV77_04450 [Cyanobacteria bacterium Co-bin8]|nr:hypothetical protein [Cyanobacteria bacterium Co-bin8]
MKIIRLTGVASFLLVGILGCTSAPEVINEPASSAPSLGAVPGLGWLRSATPVSDIPALTANATDAETHLEGQVQQQVPLFNQWLYELKDDSGSIWVLTPTSPPATGETVVIRARIHYEPILVQGNDIGEHYAEELERLGAPDTQAQES